MNKKGLILIFLFVVSMFGVVALNNAEPAKKMVDITLEWAPSTYRDVGEVYVEFDKRFVDTSMVLGQGDLLRFAFFYDICINSWYAYPTPAFYNGGDGCTDWYYTAENNVTEVGYLFNETRFSGWYNVMLDDISLGGSNVELAENEGTLQDLYKVKNIPLEVGWHYLTILAAELVSDANHTSWDYEYAHDSKLFYVGETRDDVPETLFPFYAPYNTVTVEQEAVAALDVPVTGYNLVNDWDNCTPRPIAVAQTGDVYQSMDIGTAAAPETVSVKAIWNSSMSDTGMTYDSQGVTGIIDFPTSPITGEPTWLDPAHMGPSAYYWVVNNYAVDPAETEFSLYEGLNVVFFVLIGPIGDGFAMYLADYYGWPLEWMTIPTHAMDTAVFRIQVGPVAATGISFGIFISVSMLGLVTALYLMRRKR